MISAAIEFSGRWSAVELYVDSGATFTILHAQVAQAMGLNFGAGRKVLVQVGDGSLIPVHLHDLNFRSAENHFAHR
jgi:predicted aspartyl protease